MLISCLVLSNWTTYLLLSPTNQDFICDIRICDVTLGSPIHQIRTIFRERRKCKQETFCLLYWCLRIFKTTLSKCDSQEPNVATFFDHYFLVENEKCETWESHNCKIR